MRANLILLLFTLAACTYAIGQDFAEDVAELSSETSLVESLVPDCQSCNSITGCSCGRAVAGADFLLVRPHFSEAVAFAEGAQTPTTFSTSARPIQFEYDGGVRAFIDIPIGSDSEAVRLGYTYLQGDVSIDGTVAAPGQFIVDPFGNLVGALTVVDPSDARFGMVLVGGDLIRTRSSVEAHVIDLDYTATWDDCLGWETRLDFGVRVADIAQDYESAITAAGAPVSLGTFAANFTGAGPRLGLQGRKYLGAQGRISILAAMHASLLLGDYDVASATSLGGGAFVASQMNPQRRTIPVLESEVGGVWQVTDSLDVSVGWLFQAWHDLGVSGGTFGGFFAGSDDANTMSFDGGFVRVEYWR